MDEINSKQVGERIKEIRFSLGHSMEKFGEYFNTSKGTVNNWEKGRNLPNKENLKKIAELGNKTIGEILYGSYEKRIIEELKNVSWIYDFNNVDLDDLAKKINDDIISKYGYIQDFTRPEVEFTSYISYSLEKFISNRKIFKIDQHTHFQLLEIPSYRVEDTGNDETIFSFTNLELIFTDSDNQEDIVLDSVQVKYKTLLEIDYVFTQDKIKNIVFEGLEKIETPKYKHFFPNDTIQIFKKIVSEKIYDFIKKDNALMIERIKKNNS